MVERTISLGTYVTMNDVRRVVAAAKEIGDDEQLIVSMNAFESDKADSIFAVLEKNDFECTNKGASNGHEYYIIARKKH
ncbi:MAG: hypothetical protein K0R80_2481 [Clostridia bacterium]|jgi:uncharacterized protein (UPF0262 family)|nr:hypothetical protein [Clostridia bacterium]